MSTTDLMQCLADTVPELLEKHVCPGVAFAVLDGDDTHLQSHGTADLVKGEPMTENTVFHACSISKAVSAWGVMRLVDDGVLDLDEPVNAYLQRWQLPESRFGTTGVTARRLLSHTAGLPVEGYTGVSPDLDLPSTVDILEGRSAPMDERQLAYITKWGFDPATKHQPIRVKWAPGEKFSYSGGGYVVLDLLIEELTGLPAAEYLDEAVLKPLGMTHSTFRVREPSAAGFAMAYDESLAPLPRYRYPHCTAGGMTTDIVDLACFVRSEFCRPGIDEPGQGVIRPDSFREMIKPVAFAETAGEMDFHIGLGHFLGEFKGRRVVQHSGGSAGWRSIYFALPETGQGFAALINGSGGNEVWMGLARLWMAEQVA